VTSDAESVHKHTHGLSFPLKSLHRVPPLVVAPQLYGAWGTTLGEGRHRDVITMTLRPSMH
jgi:hypothetical protein